MGFGKSKTSYYLFYNFCNGGDLERFWKIRGGKLEEDIVRVIGNQIAEGLVYLDSIGYLHRDLKLDNIFLHFPQKEGLPVQLVSDEFLANWTIEDEIEVVIGDLGFARKMTVDGEMLESVAGCPLYTAPEMWN